MSAPNRSDMIRVQGNKQYLPVPSRVQWMRGDHPDWGIDTAVIKIDWEAGFAVMRAEVRDETGRIIGAGTKTETRKGFGDFVEKAETGAVGRALARAGYGTEDALDLEDDRFADAPVEQPGRDSGRTDAGRRTDQSAETPASAQTDPKRAEVASLMALTFDDKTPDEQKEILLRYMALVGMKIGEPAADEQLDALIEAIKGHGTDAVIEPAGSSPADEAAGSAVDVDGASDVSPASDAPPPKPNTPEYGALSPVEKANARAYWSKQPEPETLAEQLQVTA